MFALKIHLSHTEINWQSNHNEISMIAYSTCQGRQNRLQVSPWLGPGLPCHCPPGESPMDKGMHLIGLPTCSKTRNAGILSKATEKFKNQQHSKYKSQIYINMYFLKYILQVLEREERKVGDGEREHRSVASCTCHDQYQSHIPGMCPTGKLTVDLEVHRMMPTY